ncbi:MAG: hypothetical protein HIU85_02850 [Proteobacteria bacterium]|nr:hypothetical protein [Pseudomonadota bacterium]
MTVTDAQLRNRNLLTLAGLGALFLAPLVGAVWLYYGTGWRPAGHVNHGQLISPPRQLPSLDLPLVRLDEGGGEPSASGPTLFRGTWTLAYVGDGSCDAACRRTLYVMRQTRAALGTDMTRVSRVFLVTGNCCAKAYLAREHAGIMVLDATGSPGKELLGDFPPGGWAYSLFVVDPLGNLMMRYDVRRDPRGLLIDLRRLLSLSDIG